jgi:hypothetical protein
VVGGTSEAFDDARGLFDGTGEDRTDLASSSI